jgi:hypothetical protein
MGDNTFFRNILVNTVFWVGLDVFGSHKTTRIAEDFQSLKVYLYRKANLIGNNIEAAQTSYCFVRTKCIAQSQHRNIKTV